MVSPEEIYRTIQKAPPVQQKKFGNIYVGVEIKWKLKLTGGEENGKYLYICAKAWRSGGIVNSTKAPIIISFVLIAEAYPEFRSMQAESPLCVRGTISEVHSGKIMLKNVSVQKDLDSQLSITHKITHHPVAVSVLSTIVVAVSFYILHQVTGINLSGPGS